MLIDKDENKTQIIKHLDGKQIILSLHLQDKERAYSTKSLTKNLYFIDEKN